MIHQVLIFSSLALMSLNTFAEPIVFPAKGQSKQQIEQDKYSCYGWAKQESGFDPMQAASVSEKTPAVEKKSGGIVKGAAGGAILGVVIGDNSESTKRGAAAGGLIGGFRQARANNKMEQQAQQQQQAKTDSHKADRTRYDRAYAACLEGKGYTVK
jgi:hypothetical protein